MNFLLLLKFTDGCPQCSKNTTLPPFRMSEWFAHFWEYWMSILNHDRTGQLHIVVNYENICHIEVCILADRKWLHETADQTRTFNGPLVIHKHNVCGLQNRWIWTRWFVKMVCVKQICSTIRERYVTLLEYVTCDKTSGTPQTVRLCHNNDSSQVHLHKETQEVIFCRQNHDKCHVRHYCGHHLHWFPTKQTSGYWILLFSVKEICAGFHSQDGATFTVKRRFLWQKHYPKRSTVLEDMGWET